jgi:hypothetical protein
MKRLIAILLLIVLLFASVHTTWAFHYCGGYLHSVGVANGGTTVDCCETSEQTSCILTGKADKFAVIAQWESPCCFNRLVEISTDDFQVLQQQISSTIEINPIYISIDQIFLLKTPEIFQKIQYTFPPGKLVTCKVNLRVLICTFII